MPNLSKFYPIQVDENTVVYTTGSQTIQGNKNFTTRPKVNGLDVLIQGDAGGFAGQSLFDGNRPITRVPSLNTNYGGTTISGFLNNMFFPFIQASISLNSFSTNQGSNIFELGQNYTGFFASVTVNKNSDNNVRNLIILDNLTPLNLPINNVVNGTSSYNIPGIIINQNRELLSARVETGVSSAQYLTSLSSPLRFSAPYFVGLSNNILSESQFQSFLTKKVITRPTSNSNNPITEIYNPIGPQYPYFIYPWQGTYGWNSSAQTNGHIVSILDQNNFENIDLFTFSNVPITLTLSNGITATYRSARLTNTINSQFTFKFYFYT